VKPVRFRLRRLPASTPAVQPDWSAALLLECGAAQQMHCLCDNLFNFAIDSSSNLTLPSPGDQEQAAYLPLAAVCVSSYTPYAEASLIGIGSISAQRLKFCPDRGQKQQNVH
jgi:hypothetical protein